MTVITLERGSALTKQDGLMTDRGYEYIEELTRQVNANAIAAGSGSPEGVLNVAAPKLYFDSATGDYYKKTTASGDTGWVLL